jgi:hypothetical protein
MPIDTRRINGPENSTDFRDFYTKSVITKSKTKRGDNRDKDEDHRPLCKSIFFNSLQKMCAICL